MLNKARKRGFRLAKTLKERANANKVSHIKLVI